MYLIVITDCWTDYTIIYENIKNPEIKIKDQIFDEGALGYGSHRIVEINPILSDLISVKTIDTNKINKSEWKRINLDRLKFP